MNKDVSKYWFPAKKYGWGWGIPSTWQGWVTLLVFTAAMCFFPFIVDPIQNLLLFSLGVIICSTLFIGVCYMKGEPPR